MMKLKAFFALVLASSLGLVSNAQSQSRILGGSGLRLDDGTSNSITIVPPAGGWSGSVNYVLPTPPYPAGASGWIAAGTANGQIPIWSTALNSWQPSSVLSGYALGSEPFLTFAPDGGSLTNNRVASSGAGISISIGGADNGAFTIANTGVLSLAGTANQVLVNGGTVSQTGAVTLSLPQSINTSNSPTFLGLTLSGLSAGGVVKGGAGTGTLSIGLIGTADIADGSILNADINAAAGIQYSKMEAGGVAGGDLSGSYPNPTVSKMLGNTIPANAVGVLTNNGSGTLAWLPPNAWLLGGNTSPSSNILGNNTAGGSIDVRAGGSTLMFLNGSTNAVGIGGINAPAGQLSNTTNNIIFNSDSRGVGGSAFNWGSSTQGYTAIFSNNTNADFMDGVGINLASNSGNTTGLVVQSPAGLLFWVKGNGAVSMSSLTTNGVVHSTGGSGTLATSLIVDADVAAGAGIAYSKLSGTPTSLPPSGAAGGDLTGTYPNPVVAANAITSAKIADGTIVNADVSATAAIAYSKLNLTNSIVTGDIVDGSITDAKVANGISYSKLSGAPTSLPPSGAAGGDLTGTYPNPVVAANAITSAKIADGTITNADVSAAASISYSKLNLSGSIQGSDIAAGTFTTTNAHHAIGNNDNTARELRLLEPSGSGVNYTAFKAQAQAGDITYTLPNTAPTAANQVLQVQAVAGNNATLNWGAVGGGAILFARTGVIANAGNTSYNVVGADDIIGVDMSAGTNFTVNLQPATTAGEILIIKIEKYNNALLPVLTIQPNGTDKIDGANNVAFGNPGGNRRLYSDGAGNWYGW